MRRSMRLSWLSLLAAILVQPLSAAVVLVGNPAITDSLSVAQASALYLGKLNKLPNGTQVTLYELESGNPLRDEFHAKVTGKNEAQLQSYWSRLVFTGKATPPAKLANAELMKQTLAGQANAIGYLDESQVDASVKVLLKP